MPAEPCASTVVEAQSRVKEVVREADALTAPPRAGPCPGVMDVRSPAAPQRASASGPTRPKCAEMGADLGPGRGGSGGREPEVERGGARRRRLHHRQDG